jgi:3',5'-cyclic AMP phosphodiesterase CpdA
MVSEMRRTLGRRLGSVAPVATVLLLACDPPVDEVRDQIPARCLQDAPRHFGDGTRFRLAAERTLRGIDEPQWQGPFFFIQLADSQFGLGPMQGCRFAETANAEIVVEHINRLRPRFAVICGDIVDGLDGPIELANWQVAEFKGVFRRISPEIPLVLLPGNHELGNLPTPETLARYRRFFGDDYFAFSIGGVRALALDTPLLFNWTEMPQALVEQALWLQGELAAATADPPTHLIVFQHHPWFVDEVDEPDGYFNLPRQHRRSVLDAFEHAGVRVVFSGHLHQNRTHRYGAVELVTSGTVCDSAEPGLRVVKVYVDRIEHRFYTFDQVPQQIELSPR